MTTAQLSLASSPLPASSLMGLESAHPHFSGALSVRKTSGDVQNLVETFFIGIKPTAAFFRGEANPNPLSAASSAGLDVITDISALVRSLPNIDSNGLNPTAGMSSILNTLIYYPACQAAVERALIAQKVGYAEGEHSARTAVVRNAMQASGGVVYGGLRVLSLVTLLKGVDASSITAPTLLGRVTFVVSHVANALSGFIYLFLAYGCSRELYLANQFRSEFNSACKVTDANERAQLLKYVRFFEKWGVAQNEIDPAVVSNELCREALINAAEILKGSNPELNESERCNAVLQIVKAHSKGPSEARAFLEEMGKEWKFKKLAAKRQLELGSLTNASCAEEMRKIGKTLRDAQEPLSVRLARGDVEALEEAQALVAQTSPLVQKIEEVLDNNFWLNLGYLVTCVIGVIATVLSFCTLGPAGALVVALAYVAVSLMMTLLDGYRMHRALKESTPGSFDLKSLAISNVLGMLSLGGGIAITSIMSLGLVPLIASISIGVVWLAINGLTWQQLLKNQQERPDLHTFRQLLDSEGDTERLKRLFQNLPKADRRAIKLELGAMWESPKRIAIKRGSAVFKQAPNAKRVKQAVDARIAALQAKALQKQQRQTEFVQAFKILNAEHFSDTNAEYALP